MKNKTICTTLILLAVVPLWAAGRVAMSTPILKSSPDEITVTTSFSAFDPASEYRIGIGTAGNSMEKGQIDLLKEDQPVSKSLQTFKQGYTSSWFQVDSLEVQGFFLAGQDLPGNQQRVTLKVTLPRQEAERLHRFFIVIAKKYGPDTWYLEDGTEVNETHW